MAEVIVLQHVLPETPGAIGDALARAGVSLRFVRTYVGDRVPPDLGGAAGLVVMGGPMGVYEADRYRHLRDEMRLIEGAVQAGVPVLGVCLGSQLVAATLGANVHASGRKEIGWHSVRLTEAASTDSLFAGVEREFVAFHWHGDIFDLPTGAVALASSSLTECQAFRFGERTWGLLFHMEVNHQMVRAMVETFAEELRDAKLDGAAIVADAKRHLPALGAVGGTVWARWAEMLSGA
jgi:GMP synthase (glutamine-hydrolysing)